MKPKNLLKILSILVITTTLFFAIIIQGCSDVGNQKRSPSEVDPLMGDWQGKRLFNSGEKSALFAHVIAYADGEYRINFLSKFDSRDPVIAILTGKQKKEVIHVEGNDDDGLLWKGSIADSLFKGEFTGEVSGTFELKKTVRLSPTLGQKPPVEALVLFDGKNFDHWLRQREKTGYINLSKFVGGKNCVAYLESEIHSDSEQDALLFLGTDDGVKVWFNDELIHVNNVLRGADPDKDRVKAGLKKGINIIKLKVTNGDGGWGVFARLANLDGTALPNISERDLIGSSGEFTTEYLKNNDQFLTMWRVSGPYSKKETGPEALFDVSFPPEQPDSKTEWKSLNIFEQDLSPGWAIRDGVMEVVPGSGSILTKQKFTDYQLHLEFRSPFMPEATGQARGNSGVYNQGRYEVQVLDSYGLEVRDNECGGIYKVAPPNVNMCAPPTQWQTYDIKFTAARYDSGGIKIKDARISVIHNGVTIHENLDLPFATPGGLDMDMSKPGSLFLQDHSDLIQYRNIWIVEK